MGGTIGNTGVVLSIFTFYVFISVLLSLIGASASDVTPPTTPPNPGVLDYLSIAFSGIGYFISGMAFSIGALGPVFSTLLFTPLAITMLYVILSFIRGTA